MPIESQCGRGNLLRSIKALSLAHDCILYKYVPVAPCTCLLLEGASASIYQRARFKLAVMSVWVGVHIGSGSTREM